MNKQNIDLDGHSLSRNSSIGFVCTQVRGMKRERNSKVMLSWQLIPFARKIIGTHFIFDIQSLALLPI